MSYARSQPNILIVMADQLAAQATSPYGNPDVLTPNLQELADRGVVFDRSYCNAPLCAPSRASMMTGRYAGDLPVNDNSEELPSSIPTFAHSLRYAGYRTILSGKMHFVGADQLHGFEERLTTDIFPSDYMWTRYWPAQGNPPRSIGPAPGSELSGDSADNERKKTGGREYAQMLKESGPMPWNYQIAYDEETQHQALQRLRQLGRLPEGEARPWLMCVSFTQPHDPYVAPPRYWGRYEGVDIKLPDPPPEGYEPHVSDVWTNAFHGLDRVVPTEEDVYRSRRGYYAMTSYIDDKVGELVRELEALGIAEDTVVVFTSDHGDQLGERGMWFKRTMREWSVRVPLFVAGAGVAQGRRVGQNVSLVDLYPTLLELAGAEPPEVVTGELAGRSYAPFLRGETPSDWPDQVLIENFSEGTIKPIRALVRGDYKYVCVHEQPDQLYDISADPSEWHNLAGDPEHADTVAEMRAIVLDGWDPAATEREIVESQRLRMFLREALSQGKFTPWDYEPPRDTAHTWVRRTSNEPWDPNLDVKFWGR
jgi:choline-sulfatase